MVIKKIKDTVLKGDDISKDDALKLVNADLSELTDAANDIRKHFCGNKFDLCSIINAKSGKCSEDCKFCAQSAHYRTDAEEYDLLDVDTILTASKINEKKGVLRFSLVTSGRKPDRRDLDKICEIISKIKNETNLQICASLGLLDKDDLIKLKEAGLTRIHNNLECSEKFFKNVCTTHTTQDKIKTIQYAKEINLEVCSGGIFGLGENWEDRIDLALVLRNLNVMSIPLNFLCKIKGTPFESNKILEQDEILRICAIFRFINPKAFIRLAGGRFLTGDCGERAVSSGINSLISGDMLTTTGATIKSDIKMAEAKGFVIKL